MKQIAVREPADHIKISTTDKIVTQWHRDGLGKYSLDDERKPSVKWIILWTNGTPTDLRDRNCVRYHCEPYDVVLIDNRNIWHRCPPCEDGRFFVRILEPDISKAIF